MIKNTISELVNDLNKLDVESDTLILIDWKNHSIAATQVQNQTLILNNFWVLLNSSRVKGRTVTLLSSDKLKSLKQGLIRILNNSSNTILAPEEEGFSILQYSEVIVNGGLTTSWARIGQYNLISTKLVITLLRIISKPFRRLYASLTSVNFN